MSGTKIILDTNIILYLLRGDEALKTFLTDKSIYLSCITELELLSFSRITPEDEQTIKKLLSECNIINLNAAVKNHAIAIRRKYKLKLPDSIVAATATFLDLPLVSADSDFEKIKDINFIEYTP